MKKKQSVFSNFYVTGTIFLIILAGAAILIDSFFPHGYEYENQSEMRKFSTEQELVEYINMTQSFGFDMLYSMNYAISGAETRESLPVADQAVPKEAGSYAEDYSTTNIQVEGVDEADFLKNDAKYIYEISGNSVIIIDAYPAEQAKIISEINFTQTNTTPTGLFVNDDKLVVIASSNYYYRPFIEDFISMSPYTAVYIYDISDRENPVLDSEQILDGTYYNSRMIGDYAYIITNQQVYSFEHPDIPGAAYKCSDGSLRSECFNVWYFDVPDTSYQFTIINSIDIKNPANPDSEVFFMGYTQDMYVSSENIYITYSKRLSIYDFIDRLAGVLASIVPTDVSLKINQIMASNDMSNYEKLSEIGTVLEEYTKTMTAKERLDFQKSLEIKTEELYDDISKEIEKTIIHRLSVSNGNIEHAAEGTVPGTVLDQFSMDEHKGYFRVFTTTGSWNWQSESKNHAYVLDSSLNIIGKIEDLASGERIYSSRFMGDMAYMVTFRQVDPLFVLDLSSPESPRVLGFLKVPGVSDYLHPYDNTHLIGLGRNATDEGRMLGLKLSLFDISDFENPKEVSNYVIKSRGSSSEALYEHKAFLLSREKNLLVIPVSVYDYDYTTGKSTYWNGAYAFSVDLDSGISLKGNITHMNQTNNTEYYYDYGSSIRRSLYMENVLYTVSYRAVKMNSIGNLDEINILETPYEGYEWPVVYRTASSPGVDVAVSVETEDWE